MLAIPVFFLAFCLVYNPASLSSFLDMGSGLYSFNLSILFAILIVSLALLRSLFSLVGPSKGFSLAQYILWCLGECMFASLFVSLFLTLMQKDGASFFSVLLSRGIPLVYLTLIYPYALLTLSYFLADGRQKASAPAQDNSLIRFFDYSKKPKLLIAVSAVLYIQSEENYVNIWYMDNGRAVKYNLRSSMSALEENCERHGLVRCQRSYIINPEHVTILRKENSWIFADLDIEGMPSIPVSRRYYDKLANLL